MTDTTRPRWRGWVRDIALLLLLVAGITAFQTRHHVSGAPPPFDLPQLDTDTRVSSASLRGRPTLLYFWAPWCGVCEAASDNVAATHAAATDANVLSVALEYRSLGSVREFVARNEVTYPVLLGPDGMTEDWAVTAFPTVYILDRDGAVSSTVVGYTTELGLRARLWWASR